MKREWRGQEEVVLELSNGGSWTDMVGKLLGSVEVPVGGLVD
jgi:hypothetical protein